MNKKVIMAFMCVSTTFLMGCSEVKKEEVSVEVPNLLNKETFTGKGEVKKGEKIDLIKSETKNKAA